MQTKRRKVVDDDDEQMQMNVPMAGDQPNQMNGQNADHGQSQNLYGPERKNSQLEAVED